MNQVLLEAGLAVIGTLLLVMGGYITHSLAKLIDSVGELNIKIAVIISQVEQHGQRITRLENKP